MGWFDYHLWEFTIAERRYGLPMVEDWGTEPRADANEILLRDLLKQPNTMIDYIYDFGDCWVHRLTITNVRAGDANLSYPRYISGEQNGPPEHCGGLSGFYETLDAATDPEQPDHAEAKLWFDDYDPNEIDEVPIKFALAGSQIKEMVPRPASRKRNGIEHDFRQRRRRRNETARAV